MAVMDAAWKAGRSLGTPGIIGIIATTILVTLLALVGFVVVVGWGTVALVQHMQTPWLQAVIVWGGSIGAAVFAHMLFPGIMPLIVSFFDDRIADIINQHDYPQVPQGAPVPFWPEVLGDIGFSLKAILYNILCLPLYLVPVINIFLFYVLNGYLLGREFFVMAARRYMPRAEAEQMRRTHAFRVFSAGVLVAFLATVPLVNLIVPFWAVALTTHLFHELYDGKAFPRVTYQGR